MKNILLVFALITGIVHAQTLPPVPSTPVNIIFDTDIGSDADDAHALAILLKLRQLGYFNVKAVTASTWLNKAPAFLNLMLKHGGLTAADIPIGAYQGARPAATGGGCFDGDNADIYLNAVLTAKASDPDAVPNVGRSTFPDATLVIRKALATSADGSVIILTEGGHTNIAALMQSSANFGGDTYPSGITLWNTKVLKLVAQMSDFPSTFPYTASPFTKSPIGYNSSCDAPATKYVAEHNGAVPLIQNPSTVSMRIGGCYNGLGTGCTSAMPPLSPARQATAFWDPSVCSSCDFNTGAGNKGRPAWDPNALFFALVGTTNPGSGAYNTLSANGTLTYTATNPASVVWNSSTPSNHFFAINTSNWPTEQTLMNDWLQGDYLPPTAPSTHPRLLVNDSVADTWNPTTYPGGGTSGRLAAITARALGGVAGATTDFATLRSVAPTGVTPGIGNGQDEGSLDQVLAYGLSYLIYHKSGNDTSANPYALALYNGLKAGTAYNTTYPVYGVTQIVVASNVATVTLASAPGAEITVGGSIGVWGCALVRDPYCGAKSITGVSGSTFTFAITSANMTITDSGMVATASYSGVDSNGQIGVALASWAYLYDWCNPWLVANGHAAEVINYIKAAYWASTLTRPSSEFDNNIRESDFHNYTVWLESAILEAGVAINGDDALGATMITEGLGYLYQGISVTPAQGIPEAYTYNIKASVDAMTQGAFNWEGSVYSRNAVPRILRAIEAYDTSTARASNLWQTQFSTAQNFGFYRLYVRDPNGTIANFGDTTNLKTYVGKDSIGLAIINDRFPDGHFTWMMDTGINNWNDGASIAASVWKLIFYPYVNGPTVHDLTDLPLARRFGADVVIRSGWGPNDTMFTMTGWLPGVYHRQNSSGSFSLYRGGYLAAAPNYGTTEYPLYDGWLKRTVASNSITIYDSTDCQMDNIATCGSNSYGQLLTNDGGQRITTRRLNPPYSVGEFGLSRTWSGSLFTDPTYGSLYSETHGVQFPALTTGSGYERVTLDMTKAYTNSYSGSGHNTHAKTPLTNGVVRDVVHFQPVSGSIDPVIIFDKVTSANAAFPKSWMVHTIGAPQVGGSWTNATAGIASSSASAMRADNGTGRLYLQSLLPASPTLRTVGGNSCTARVVSDATVANPAVFTIPSHGLTVGERVAFDVGTYSPTKYDGYNVFGSHPSWLLDAYEFVVSTVVDANHVIFSVNDVPFDSRIDPYTGGAMPTFVSEFNNVGTGTPTIGGFLQKMYYQSDAAGGNTAWIYNGSSWTHIGENANGLTAPTLYKHSACDFSYWVDQAGPQGSAGANLWVFPQELLPQAAKPNWRVELRPSVAAATDYFLNVLTPSTTSDTTGPTTTTISAAGWSGAQVSDLIETFVVMFPQTSGAVGVAYTSSHSGGGKHVVTGLSAATPYSVTQGVTSLGIVTSDANGALTFTETGGGSFVVGTPVGGPIPKFSGNLTMGGGVVIR